MYYINNHDHAIIIKPKTFKKPSAYINIVWTVLTLGHVQPSNEKKATVAEN